MQTPFRSRKPVRPATLEPETTPDAEIVEGVVQPADQALVPGDYYAEPERPEKKIRRPRRRTAGLPVPRFTLFVIAFSLMIAGVFFTLLNTDAVSEQVTDLYPAVSLAAAGVWSFGALIRRDSTAFVAGAALAGVSLSLLLETQEVAMFSETVVGILLITLGLSVVIRGLLIRPRVVRSS